MEFSTPLFLFLFLPLSIFLHSIVDKKYRNVLALFTSLIFYAISSFIFLPVVILSILFNYGLGILIDSATQGEEKQNARIFLFAGIIFNVGLLLVFKFIAQYADTFFLNISPDLFTEIMIPLGLSYITFQNIAYLVDIAHQRFKAEKNLVDFSLYILLFPKLLAGPIVLYHDVREQIKDRELDMQAIVEGIQRFIFGMAKKVLIANTLASTIHRSLKLSSPDFSSKIAWFILAAYTIQIYFDFSGYTDMALGIGKMMGFTLPENFNYPYIAESITDFWRRWHISLSSWMREYVFIPLEVRRRKVRFLRQPTNILITFMLTGLWHGLTLNYLLWGGLHGLALGLESSFLSKMLKKTWKPIRHIYTLAVVMLGWIFFRADSIQYAVAFIGRLLGIGPAVNILPYQTTAPLPIIDPTVWIALGSGIVLSLPIIPRIRTFISTKASSPAWVSVGRVAQYGFSLLIFLLCIGAIASYGYKRSIYGQF